MIFVPGSDFFRGNPGKKGNDTSSQSILVEPFYIDIYPVTHRDYNAVDPCWSYDPQKADFPVTGLTYDDILHYCTLTNKRLPTEIEWEKAARGNRDRRIYPWGDDFSKDKCNCRSFFFLKPQPMKPVGAYPEGKSPYGCFDMSGNAWEWTATSPKEDFFILKGGSCTSPSRQYLAIHSRLVEHRSCINLNYGFRCCAAVPDADDKEQI